MKRSFLVMIILPLYLLAWGKLGHQITAKIAEIHLTQSAKAEVKQVLGNTDLVAISDWADVIRPSKRFIKWHYTTMDENGLVHENKKNGLLYYGLNQAIRNYRNKNLSQSERATALKLIVHLVGDAHQPLHVGNGYDAGGNLCGVKWFKRKNLVSLHKIWDVFLVKAFYAKNPWIVSDTIHMTAGKDAMAWLQESRALHKTIYPKHCAKSLRSEKIIHLGNDYVIQHLPIVRERLILGGLRLANILNG